MVAIRGAQYNQIDVFKGNCINFTTTLYLHNTTQKGIKTIFPPQSIYINGTGMFQEESC